MIDGAPLTLSRSVCLVRDTFMREKLLSLSLYGRTMSGKSVAWKTLMNAKTQMCKDGVEGYHPVSLVYTASYLAPSFLSRGMHCGEGLHNLLMLLHRAGAKT